MHVLFETRFSFFGQSGWKSAHAADPAQLFEPSRLDMRLKLFETITLESLKGQTNGRFRLLVLSSTLMPEPYQNRLRDLCNDTLGAERARVIFRPEGSAGHIIRNSVSRVYGDKQVAQVVLDDDDAVSVDYVDMLRKYARIIGTDPHNERDYTFLSFPRGYTLGLENGKISWLSPRYVPYTNLGLALVGPGTARKNPFLTSHKKIGERQPSFMVTHLRPYYLRAVHGFNDSNAHVDKNHLAPEEIAKSLRYFPWLAKHFPGIRPASDIAAQ